MVWKFIIVATNEGTQRLIIAMKVEVIAFFFAVCNTAVLASDSSSSQTCSSDKDRDNKYDLKLVHLVSCRFLGV